MRRQYAHAGRAAFIGSGAAVAALRRAGEAGIDTGDLITQYEATHDHAERFIASYRHCCWPVENVQDLKLAPFHILATEGRVHIDKPHSWHMERPACVAREGSDLLVATPCLTVDLSDPASEGTAIGWWETRTAAGSEGMVVKPSDFVAKGRRGLVQPAVKCRSVEYLRIIYGPDYTVPENLERLRQRGLGAKRSLAIREFALGVEGLERFVRNEPLRRVHECVFAVALESEPVDPRL